MKTLAKLLVLAILTIGLCTVLACPSGTSATTYPNATSADKPRMAAFSPGQVGPFVIPASWKQATWFIDPANVSTCASDNNRTCASSSCTSGDGPCLTLGSVTTRWGTQSPIIQQATLITYMSQPASIGDPIVLSPQIGQPDAQLGIVCQLGTAQQTSTGTITVVNSKVRTKGASTLLTVTYPAGAAAGNLVINTMHPSRALIYKASGGNFTTSQPFAPVPAASGVHTPFSEVDTWTTGDTVTTYALITIPLTSFAPGPYITGASPKFQSGYISQCNIFESASGPTLLTTAVNLFESTGSSPIVWNSAGANSQNTIVVNFGASIASSFYVTTVPIGTTRPFEIIGGYYSGTSVMSGITLAGDTIVVFPTVTTGLVGSQFVNGGTDGVYLDTNTLHWTGNGSGVTSNGAVIWGTGTINIENSAKFQYPAGASGGTNFFLQTGLTLNGGSTLDCVRNLVDSGAPVCSVTLSNTGLDSVNGSISGCVFQPGGASLCNYGP